MNEQSQAEYCRGCILRPGCNVILKDGEKCEDREEKMKTRTTNYDLDQAQTILNRALEYAGSSVRVKCQGRYGYIGIDRFDTKDRCMATIKTGLTKGQALTFLEAMIEAVDFAGRK